jgi:hypothetical protein
MRKTAVPVLPEIRHVAARLRLHHHQGLLRGLRYEHLGESLGQRHGLGGSIAFAPVLLTCQLQTAIQRFE